MHLQSTDRYKIFRAMTDIKEDIIDEDGEVIFKKDTLVEGYYADGYILGECADVEADSIAFESWVKINVSTLQIYLGYHDGEHRWRSIHKVQKRYDDFQKANYIFALFALMLVVIVLYFLYISK